eukprot:TRINITY_DN3887_c0_g1_i1.p1 TRINITY_DN3887_c0_g1~~TRINITY_DN3887_c0_g1_i1.p1  ORF type:complete len:320 (-),score=61.30 TRINITY_DN3887_c0_g1_i1:173-1090(-)
MTELLSSLSHAVYPSYNWTWHGLTVIYGADAENQSHCEARLLFPNGYLLTAPMLIPFSLLALFIGLYCSGVISSSGRLNSLLYRKTFFLYGLMMTSAMFTDSLIPFNAVSPVWKIIHLLVGLIDVTFTSCIAASFFFNGLADMKLIDENSKKSLIAQIVMYSSIAMGWIYTFSTGSFASGFKYLYIFLILGFCGSYVIFEAIFIVYRGHREGLGYLILAGLSGGGGLALMMKVPVALCLATTPFMGGQSWWFLGSDLAMFFIFKFYMINHVSADTDEDVSPSIRTPPTSSAVVDMIELQPLYIAQ